ncbi:hypothetical protein BH23ACI1_BH23ACI1_16000 [soil metagenome]
MTAPACLVHGSGTVEQYFYGELSPAGRLVLEQHMTGCSACRQSLEDLAVIRSALAARPHVAGPPSGDWAPLMARLEQAIAAEPTRRVPEVLPARRVRRPLVQALSMAALLAIVSIGVLLAARAQPDRVDTPRFAAGQTVDPLGPADVTAGEFISLAAGGQQHLDRSKLVLLGLTSKDADGAVSAEWDYERELASRLLDDTRLYRLVAEERGLTTMAGVMRDLEFVLLQASMTEGNDTVGLSQIQRAIHKRDLLQKMDVVRSAGI